MVAPNPADLLAKAQFLEPREFAGLFSAATCKDGGETHGNLEKIIEEFDLAKVSIWLLAMMQQGEFTVGWDEEKGEIIHQKTTPEQKARILAALKDFDEMDGD